MTKKKRVLFAAAYLAQSSQNYFYEIRHLFLCVHFVCENIARDSVYLECLLRHNRYSTRPFLCWLGGGRGDCFRADFLGTVEVPPPPAPSSSNAKVTLKGNIHRLILCQNILYLLNAVPWRCRGPAVPLLHCARAVERPVRARRGDRGGGRGREESQGGGGGRRGLLLEGGGLLGGGAEGLGGLGYVRSDLV